MWCPRCESSTHELEACESPPEAPTPYDGPLVALPTCAVEGCGRSVLYQRQGSTHIFHRGCSEHDKDLAVTWREADFVGLPLRECGAPGLPGDVGVVHRVKPLGRKDDQYKLRFDLMPPDAERAVVKVLTHGARKYGDNNWTQVENARWRYLAAARRHLSAWQLGEVRDPESDLPHLAHAVCSLLFLLDLELRGELK